MKSRRQVFKKYGERLKVGEKGRTAQLNLHQELPRISRYRQEVKIEELPYLPKDKLAPRTTKNK